jgi:hypothetical protein
MQLEAVGRVTMGDLGLKVGGQIYDVNSAKGTFLRADTTSDAETLRDEGDFRIRSDFDTQLARAHHGA